MKTQTYEAARTAVADVTELAEKADLDLATLWNVPDVQMEARLDSCAAALAGLRLRLDSAERLVQTLKKQYEERES